MKNVLSNKKVVQILIFALQKEEIYTNQISNRLAFQVK